MRYSSYVEADIGMMPFRGSWSHRFSVGDQIGLWIEIFRLFLEILELQSCTLVLLTSSTGLDSAA